MFCSSLRQRRDLTALIPLLAQANSPALRESKLVTHDLALPLPAVPSTGHDQQPSTGQQHQLFLLLTADSVSGNDRTSLLSRIERFASLTTDPLPAIAFLLFAGSVHGASSNSFHAYMTLQVWQASPIAPSSRPLLRQVTATAPMCPLSEHSTNVLSDLCHSVGEVAAMTASEQGMQVLEDFLGEEEAKNIESFWAEEWICD
ncbi:MAG: hypothetical protein Q9168_006436 [Polycauliona sp. 1 TL-2023]